MKPKWRNLWSYSGVCLNEPRKIRKVLCQNIRLLVQDSNSRLSEALDQEVRLLTYYKTRQCNLHCLHSAVLHDEIINTTICLLAT